MAHTLNFEGLVDTLGRAAEDVALPDDVRTLGDSAVRAMVNKQFVNLGALVATRRP